MIEPERVDAIFRDCLFKDGEDHSKYVEARGIITHVGFHPGRLESHRDQVESWLNELPEPFHEETGGGWSFLNACTDKSGKQWTGMHIRMEQLIQLGIAIGKVRELLPREEWKILPGGMPYYVVVATPAELKVVGESNA